MCVLCFAWRHLQKCFIHNVTVKHHMVAHGSTHCRHNMLDKHVIITPTAAAFLPDLASAALALTSDAPSIACKL